MRSQRCHLLLILLLVIGNLPHAAFASDSIHPSDVVLNAYVALRAKIVAEGDERIIAAVSTSQAYFWDYEETTRSAIGDNWTQVSDAEKKWELVSTIGTYLHNALTRLMGSEHAVTGVNVIEEKIMEDRAVVTAEVILASGGTPISVYFLLKNTPQGWKIFDFSAPSAGFYLALNLRANLLPALLAHGVPGAISHLRQLSDP